MNNNEYNVSNNMEQKTFKEKEEKKSNVKEEGGKG